MSHTPAPPPYDNDAFDPKNENPPVRYGLPSKVTYCKSCVISNQRPNSTVEFKSNANSLKTTIMFDDDGICDACRVAETKHRETDWEKRERELAALCDKYRSRNGSYDCIVPGSGGKDSVYAAHVLKTKYGMHPLTVTWAPHLYTDIGWQNFQAWIHSGFDNVLHTPNGRVHRLLTRLAVENLFHPFQPFILGQKNLAPKLAALYKIPLVFFGENEAEYGNPRQSNDSSQRSREFYSATDEGQMFLGGESITSLKEDYGLQTCDLEPYLPANPDALDEIGLEVHYLGYYLKWRPQDCYYYAVEHCGFRAAPERTPGTYSKYNSLDDKIDDFHYYTTYIKFGIGRTTYDAAQEIRSGEIDRDEGVALIKRFDGEWPERYADEIFQYLSITKDQYGDVADMFEQPVVDKDYFMRLTDKFRSPHLWAHNGNSWALRHPIWEAEG